MDSSELKDAGSGASSSARRWLDSIIARVFSMMHAFEADNFDANRYRDQQPNMFFADSHAAYFSFVLENLERFHRARELLEDASSRELYDQLILFRTLSHLHVRLPFNTSEYRAYAETADSWKVIETEDEGLMGPLAIFLVPGGSNEDIHVKCWKENVMATWLQRQYYFRRGDAQVMPLAGDTIIDAGGCFGDTALGFASTVGADGHVHTFDPLPQHCTVIRQNLKMNSLLAPRISVHEVGLSASARTGRGFPEGVGAINPGATAFDDAISTTTMDALCADGSIARVDFIKMDIEGSELDALRGAEQVLREQRPRLAISLYHRPQDFFEIPLWLSALDCGYRFYLDHYSMHREETVLYAAVN